MTQGMGTFFCYSREDSDFALRLAKDLRDRGVEIWIDQLDIPAGAAWDRTIEQAIRSCGRMLIVLSPHSVASENVMDEVSFALDQGDRVVPVLLEACDVPLRIRRLQHIDFTKGYEQGLDKLARALATTSRADGAETSDPTPASAHRPGPDPVLDSPPPGPSDASAPPTPATTGRKKLLIAIAAVIALVTIIGLASKSKRPVNRKQTSAAGSGLVVVPSVIGVAQDRALAALAKQKLEGTVTRTEETCRKPAGTIVSQDPSGMTQAKVGSAVRLAIAQRTPIPIPKRSADTTVLAPGAGHAVAGRERRPNRVEFMLAGEACSAGTVIVSHPSTGREVYEIRAGERGNRNIVYGPGKITIQFESLNKGARLVVRTD